MRAGVALGSNLGDRLSHLRAARRVILALPDVLPRSDLSAPVYETVPVNCPPGTGRFLNSVLTFEYAGTPEALLGELLDIETARGRERQPGRVNEPRPLDLDLLYLGDLTRNTTRLILPHPRMLQRRFVLTPLARIDPGLVLPGDSRPVAEILRHLEDDPSEVELASEQW